MSSAAASPLSEFGGVNATLCASVFSAVKWNADPHLTEVVTVSDKACGKGPDSVASSWHVHGALQGPACPPPGPSRSGAGRALWVHWSRAPGDERPEPSILPGGLSGARGGPRGDASGAGGSGIAINRCLCVRGVC